MTRQSGERAAAAQAGRSKKHPARSPAISYLFKPMHILVIHAHPDDVEILAAGTIMPLIAGGNRVTICSMTAGDCGSAEHGPEEISRIRRGEAAAAAQLVGADYVCAEFRDLAIFNDDPSRRRVTELLRRVQPDIVITASPVDYH